MAISYTKLRDGGWGLRVSGQTVTPGQVVTVTKKDGSTKQEVADKVIWSGDGLQICSIKLSASPKPSGGRNICAECGRPGRLVCDLEDGLLKHYNCCDIPPGGY
jgi:hypothetical protein